MILVLNAQKEDFESKLDRLFETVKDENDVSFAIGSCYNDTDLNIRKALRTADENMYKDKNEYYLRHPEQKYR